MTRVRLRFYVRFVVTMFTTTRDRPRKLQLREAMETDLRADVATVPVFSRSVYICIFLLYTRFRSTPRRNPTFPSTFVQVRLTMIVNTDRLALSARNPTVEFRKKPHSGLETKVSTRNKVSSRDVGTVFRCIASR